MHGAYGNRIKITHLLTNLGTVAMNAGKYPQAEVYLREGLQVAQKIKHQIRIGLILGNLGRLATLRGEDVVAKAFLEKALALITKTRSDRQLDVLINLAILASERGEYAQAKVYVQEGLPLARKIKYQEMIGSLLQCLGDVETEQGNYTDAAVHLQEALEIGQQIGHPELISGALLAQGRYYLLQQAIGLAEATFGSALQAAPEERLELIADVHYGLAQTAASRDDTNKAVREGEQSLTILQKIGHRRAITLEQWLTNLPK